MSNLKSTIESLKLTLRSCKFSELLAVTNEYEPGFAMSKHKSWDSGVITCRNPWEVGIVKKYSEMSDRFFDSTIREITVISFALELKAEYL